MKQQLIFITTVFFSRHLTDVRSNIIAITDAEIDFEHECTLLLSLNTASQLENGVCYPCEFFTIRSNFYICRQNLHQARFNDFSNVKF